MPHQLGGFCAVLFLLGLLALLDYSDKQLSAHYQRSVRVQRELQRILQRAQRQMQRAATKLAGDSSFIKNLTWGLTHSAQQAITAAIAGAEQWQVTVFGKHCALLHGSHNRMAQELCRSMSRGQVRVFTSQAPPLSGYLHAFSSNAGAVLVALPLNEEWLAHQQSLATLRAALPPTRLMTDELSAVQLLYTQDYRNHLYRHASRYRTALLWARVLLYLSLVVLCIMLYVLVRRRTHALHSELQHLAVWSAQLHLDNQVKVKHPLVQSILHNVSRAMQAQLHYLASVKQQIAVKNKLVTRLSKENQRVKDTLAQQALAHAVIEQAAQFNAHFIADNVAIRDNAQDLRAAIFAVHRRQLKPLLQLSSRWRREFDHRHVAAFLGAYHNTTQENFLLSLEQDVRRLATLVEETYAALTGTLQFTRQLSHRTRSLLIPLRSWEQALSTHSMPRDTDITRVLRQAQVLTAKIAAPRHVKFNNHGTASYQIQAVPAMLVAAFYHLYQFFLPETPENIELSNYTAIKNKQLYVTVNTSNTAAIHSGSKKFHLNQARLLLQKYHITVLPSWVDNSLIVSTSAVPSNKPRRAGDQEVVG